MSTIFSFGAILFDEIEGHYYLGGAPLNFAWYVKEFGYNISMIGCVGKDSLGDQAIEIISNSGINSLIARSEKPTGIVKVKSDGGFVICRGSAWEDIPMPDLTGRKINLLYFGTLEQISKTNRSTLRSLCCMNPAQVILDLNLRQNLYSKQTIMDSLGLASIVKINEPEWKVLQYMFRINDPRDLMVTYQIQTLALTRGSQEASLFIGSDTYISKPPTVPTIETTGAGDAFTAALAVGLLEGKDPAMILKMACKAGSNTVAARGALVKLDPALRKYLSGEDLNIP